jgi:hypothetical protein
MLVAVVPQNPYRILADPHYPSCFHGMKRSQIFQFKQSPLGWLAVLLVTSIAALRTGTGVAEKGKRVTAPVSVLPLDFDALTGCQFHVDRLRISTKGHTLKLGAVTPCSFSIETSEHSRRFSLPAGISE